MEYKILDQFYKSKYVEGYNACCFRNNINDTNFTVPDTMFGDLIRFEAKVFENINPHTYVEELNSMYFFIYIGPIVYPAHLEAGENDVFYNFIITCFFISINDPFSTLQFRC